MSTLEPAQAPEILRRLITSHFVSQAIYVVAKLDLADQIADGPRTAAQLAAFAGVHEPTLARVLRSLTDPGVLAETPDGFVLTEVGRCLRNNVPDSIRHAAILFAEEPYQACGDLLQTVRTGQTAFDRVYGKGHFEYLAENSEAARTFHEAMTQLTTVVSGAVVEAYDFSKARRLVDVGGGEGLLLALILRATPHLRGVLFEAPPALPNAQRLLERLEVHERCEIVAGDFFREVPRGGDLYLLKSVLHDWDDERSIAILTACRRAIPETGRLLIVERVIPEASEPSFGRCNDIIMLVVSGGCERTGVQYRALLERSGFTLSQIVPTGSGFHIIEAMPVEI